MTRLLHYNFPQSTLCAPLNSLCKHLTQRGCGFLGDDRLGDLFVCFPTFVLAVDTTKDCHLSYKPIGRKAALRDLDYVQPWCALKVPPQPEIPSPPPQSKDWKAIRYSCHSSKQGPAPIPSNTQEPVSQNKVPPVSDAPPVATSPPVAVPVLNPDLSKIKLLSTMSHEDILKYMHHPDTILSEVRT